MNKIIFLDIDGVLNNARYASLMNHLYGGNGYGGMHTTNTPRRQDIKWDPYNVGELKHLMNKTGASIVISSSWRRFHTLKDFKYMFQLYGLKAGKIVGDTILNGAPGWIRGDYVNQYVSDNDIDNYVILDDDAKFYDYQNLIRTDPEYGLTDTDMLKAVKILNKGS